MMEIARYYPEYERRLNEICTEFLGVPSRVSGGYQQYATIIATCKTIQEYEEAVKNSLELYNLSDANQLASLIEPSWWSRFTLLREMQDHIGVPGYRDAIIYELDGVTIVEKHHSHRIENRRSPIPLGFCGYSNENVKIDRFDFVISDKTGAITCFFSSKFGDYNRLFNEALHTVVGDRVKLVLQPLNLPKYLSRIQRMQNSSL